MWAELRGKWNYAAGANGTVTVPKGASVLQIIVEGAATATVTIFGGAAIPCASTAPRAFRFNHLLAESKTGATDIVFSGAVTSYFVEWTEPQGNG